MFKTDSVGQKKKEKFENLKGKCENRLDPAE